MVVIAFGSGVSGQSRTARISRQAVSVNQNPAVSVQSNCVNAPAMPDIVLVSVEIFNPEKKYAPGKTYPVTAIIENRGQCETGCFRVQISVQVQDMDANRTEERVILNQVVQSIQPIRDRNPAHIEVPTYYTLGGNYNTTYTFWAVADPEDHVKEFVENNNSIEKGAGPGIDVGARIR
jgi:hypothetical protein